MDLKFAHKLIKKTNRYFEQFATAFSSSRAGHWPLILSLLHYIKKGDKVLDLGCGNGRVYPLVLQKGAYYLGIDNSKNMLSKARKNYREGKFQLGNILDLRLKKKFDVVFLIAVLHHIPSKKLRKKALQNVYDTLKPGGYVLIANWNLFQKRFWRLRWRQNIQKILGKSQMDWNDIIFKRRRYYHGFKKGEIARLLRRAGFKILENYYELEGKRVGRWGGRNLVTVAKRISN